MNSSRASIASTSSSSVSTSSSTTATTSSSTSLTRGLPSKFPAELLFSPEFLQCAGSILFDLSPVRQGRSPQICLLYHLRKHEYLLPKGRKDQGEGSLLDAALRETYEETGYPCTSLPVPLATRATVTGVDAKDTLLGTLVPECIEPFALTIRHVTSSESAEGVNVKLISWFISQVSGPKEQGTQMPSEDFESCWFDCDEAAERLTFEHDRAVVRKAIILVDAALKAQGDAAAESEFQKADTESMDAALKANAHSCTLSGP